MEFVIDQGGVEVQFAGGFGLELPGVEVDDEVAELLDVEEQQVDTGIVAVDLEVHLPAGECETRPELSEVSMM